MELAQIIMIIMIIFGAVLIVVGIISLIYS